MSGSAAVAALGSYLSVLLIIVWFFWLYRDYRMDLLRQRLFTLRDELFDVARHGELSFDHPMYGLLRTTLNGFIRWGGRLGMIMVLWLVLRRPDRILGDAGVRGFEERWVEGSGDLSAATRDRLVSITTRMHLFVVEHLVFTSLTLLLSLVPLVVLGLIEVGRQRFLNLLRSHRLWAAFRSRWIDPLDSAALSAGA